MLPLEDRSVSVDLLFLQKIDQSVADCPELLQRIQSRAPYRRTRSDKTLSLPRAALIPSKTPSSPCQHTSHTTHSSMCLTLHHTPYSRTGDLWSLYNFRYSSYSIITILVTFFFLWNHIHFTFQLDRSSSPFLSPSHFKNLLRKQFQFIFHLFKSPHHIYVYPSGNLQMVKFLSLTNYI